MSRLHRVAPGGLPFHVLNRAVGRRAVFQSAADYEGFIDSVAETLRIRRMRICGYCVMPNHWHMVLWPEQDGDLSAKHRDLWIEHVKRTQTEGELAGVRASVNRGRPYGDDTWVTQVANRLDLGATMRPRGRPKARKASTHHS